MASFVRHHFTDLPFVGGSTLAKICHQRAKVRWRVLSRDYQVSDFVLSSIRLATILFYLFVLYPAASQASLLYYYLSLPLSLYLSFCLSPSLFQSVSKMIISFTYKSQRETHAMDVRTTKNLHPGWKTLTQEEKKKNVISAWEKEKRIEKE